jgi:hypothetical protein
MGVCLIADFSRISAASQFYPPSLGGSRSIVAQQGILALTDLSIDKMGRHQLRFAAWPGVRASLQPVLLEANGIPVDSGQKRVFGGLGLSSELLTGVMSVSTWLIVRPGKAYKLLCYGTP